MVQHAKMHQKTVEGWRQEAGETNPAGPLFLGGRFAIADMVGEATMITGCSLCTGSVSSHCCA